VADRRSLLNKKEEGGCSARAQGAKNKSLKNGTLGRQGTGTDSLGGETQNGRESILVNEKENLNSKNEKTFVFWEGTRGGTLLSTVRVTGSVGGTGRKWSREGCSKPVKQDKH